MKHVYLGKSNDNSMDAFWSGEELFEIEESDRDFVGADVIIHYDSGVYPAISNLTDYLLDQAMRTLNSTQNPRYEVYETNAGGLVLFVFDQHGECIKSGCEFEYRDGTLSAYLNELDAGASIDTLVLGNHINYHEWLKQMGEYGAHLIAHGVNGKRILHTDAMGCAGMLEFGVSERAS